MAKIDPLRHPKIKYAGPDECWLWLGQTCNGYGRSGHGFIHRRMYERLVGPIPAGLEIDHLCRVTTCVNPRHLEPVTRLENRRRRSAVQTHCRNGHEFNEVNTRIAGRTRACRICNRAAVARLRARRQQAATR